VEVVIGIAIVGVLAAITIPAIQKGRSVADRARCSNQLRQLTLALVRYHDEHGGLPMGVTPDQPKNDYPYMTWLTRLLPYLEQDALWR
jgi:type II secretory pathway pseudopilin PulG